MNTTYQEDSEFVLGLQGMAVLDVERQKLELKDAIRESRNAYDEAHTRLQEMEQELRQEQEELDKRQQEYVTFLSERGTLESMSRLSRNMSATEAEKRKAEEEYNRLQTIKNQTEHELHQWKVALSDGKARLHTVQTKLQEKLEDWETLYQEYYAEGVSGEWYRNLASHELDAKFKAEKAVFEKTTIVLDDKKKLIDTLKYSMERAKKSIKRRGILLEDLEKLQENHQLFAVPEEELEELSQEVARITVNVDHIRADVERRKQKATRLEGSIEQAIMTLEERFGSYVEQEIVPDDIEVRIADEEEAVRRLNDAYKQLEHEYQQYSREYTTMMDLYKDVKRIVETNEISLQKAKVLMLGKDKLRDTFEASLLSYDKSTKALERAKQELQRYKTQTAQALSELQAYELAQTINDDIEIPRNLGEAKQLRDSLTSMIHVISLEKERIGQSIEDMQFIKSNFEKQ
jgi:chromosome segregation ATPase